MTSPVEGERAGEQLAIGELAERVGLSVAALRMWETRYGFPLPQRLVSGHRRYTEADASALERILARRSGGIRLEMAIEEEKRASTRRGPSIFAALRHRHPDLAVTLLRKPTLVALSRAIEDECCAAADRPVIFGAFQRPEFYEQSSHRWQELARAARSTVVFAEGWVTSAPGERPPLRAGLGPDSLLRREWAVVTDAGEVRACLAAWELPGQQDVPDRLRRFEAVWTLDPAAVRDASLTALEIAEGAGLDVGPEARAALREPVPDFSSASRASVRVLNRVLGYADRAGAPVR